MSSEENGSKIRIVKIREGTVIDHITAGHALDVLKILGITGKEGNVVTLAMNISSSRIERKDIVKIEDRGFGRHQIKNHFISPCHPI